MKAMGPAGIQVLRLSYRDDVMLMFSACRPRAPAWESAPSQLGFFILEPLAYGRSSVVRGDGRMPLRVERFRGSSALSSGRRALIAVWAKSRRVRVRRA